MPDQKKDIHKSSLSEYSFENIALYENGKIVEYNHNFLNTFGYLDSDIRGMSLFHFFPKIYRTLVNSQTFGEERRMETICVKKDSSTFPAEIRFRTVTYNDRRLNALVVRDDSERKILENELLKSTLFQKAILDSANFSIIATDFNGVIKTFNRGAEKMFKIKAQDAIDIKNIVEFHIEEEVSERARQLTIEYNHQVAPGFEVFVEKLKFQNNDEYEWTFVRNDKTTLQASVTVTPLKDRFDEISGYLFTGIDISDKKKAEAEIIDKSQILNGIINHMPVFIFKVNAEGVFTQSIGSDLKDPYLQIDRLTGVNIYEVYPNAIESIKKAYEGEIVTFIYSIATDDKNYHFEYYVFPDQTKIGGLIGLALDIGDKIKSEEKLKRSADNLLKINKELDQFAYIVSHDLKAPLRAIDNLSQWIEEDLGNNIPEDSKTNMGLLRDRVIRMQNLIDGILSYSRVGRSKSEKEEVNVAHVVKETTNLVDAQKLFKIKIDEKLPILFTNRTLLEQIFINLISNAIKYHNKPKGNICVEYQEDRDWHIFSVADDGPGIPPDFHEKIFLIFQTLQSKDKKDSTGIGLTIVKKIVEDQGGSIWVESDGVMGSKFIFTLPKKPVSY